MRRLIRNTAPFVMLGYSLLFAVVSYCEVYAAWFTFLPDLLGYSLITNVFMMSVYFNKRYCAATKVAVAGLMTLNVCNLIYLFTGMDGVVYDIYLLCIVVVLTIVTKKKNVFKL